MKNRITYSRRNVDMETLQIMCRVSELTKKLNDLTLVHQAEREAILRELFGKVGENSFVGNNFHCDFGRNIRVGNNFHADYNCTMLDIGGITIGDNCLIGPDVGLYTAGHQLEPEGRTDEGYAAPIEIEDDVWIGGHCTILPGVTIGHGSVIAAGSVVICDIPPMTLAAGNPAVVKKQLDRSK